MATHDESFSVDREQTNVKKTNITSNYFTTYVANRTSIQESNSSSSSAVDSSLILNDLSAIHPGRKTLASENANSIITIGKDKKMLTILDHEHILEFSKFITSELLQRDVDILYFIDPIVLMSICTLFLAKQWLKDSENPIGELEKWPWENFQKHLLILLPDPAEEVKSATLADKFATLRINIDIRNNTSILMFVTRVHTLIHEFGLPSNQKLHLQKLFSVLDYCSSSSDLFKKVTPDHPNYIMKNLLENHKPKITTVFSFLIELNSYHSSYYDKFKDLAAFDPRSVNFQKKPSTDAAPLTSTALIAAANSASASEKKRILAALKKAPKELPSKKAKPSSESKSSKPTTISNIEYCPGCGHRASEHTYDNCPFKKHPDFNANKEVKFVLSAAGTTLRSRRRTPRLSMTYTASGQKIEGDHISNAPVLYPMSILINDSTSINFNALIDSGSLQDNFISVGLAARISEIKAELNCKRSNIFDCFVPHDGFHISR